MQAFQYFSTLGPSHSPLDSWARTSFAPQRPIRQQDVTASHVPHDNGSYDTSGIRTRDFKYLRLGIYYSVLLASVMYAPSRRARVLTLDCPYVSHIMLARKL